MFMGIINKVKDMAKKAASKIKGKLAKKSHKLNVYSNLSSKKTKSNMRNVTNDRDTQYLASLPKHSIKRFVFYCHPKHFLGYWFSKRGAIKALKIFGVMMVILCLFVGGLFAYFRKDLDAIRPGELAKRVQTTVNTYYDRNGQLLWEDKGAGNYKLVVKSENISNYLKQATVAMEDQDFYKHKGVSISGLARAVLNNFMGGSTQGGSSLTQQLVKQVFFSDESAKRGFDGIPRKIKEVILAIEVERMYNKDQILTLYLNESPYGGRRNGVESGSQTYFGKSSKDVTIAEAAFLAAIPQNPSVYNPYNIYGHEGLIRRQHAVLDNMVSMKYITKTQAEEAKKYPIIDHINPESDQYTNIKAPHFVQMARSQLESELGTTTVGRGGLSITTTLDLRIQTKLEEAMNEMFVSYLPDSAGFSNGAATVEDVKTGQIVALMGSRDFTYPGFGQDNAAIAFIQPGSSIKPLVYTKLFEKKPAGQLNFGSGSVLKDENIDDLYGTKVRNADQQFRGDITIRTALATSRNIPAIKAMYISGIKDTLTTIHDMGGTSYCTNGDEVNAGLASAIGGCGIKQVDLVNAYSSIARSGVYKPQTTVLEVKDYNNKVIKKWADTSGKKIVDPQSTYIVSDILNDRTARVPLSGWDSPGMAIDGVPTGTKTGTSDKGGMAKDIWMFSFSPSLAMGVWLGNSDASLLNYGTSSIPGPIIQSVMEYAHKEVYGPAGLWKTDDWFAAPEGIQRLNGEVYPSWWDKKQGKTEEKMMFDKVSKYKATAFTPDLAKIELDVIKTIDPVTKKDVYIAPDGYDATKDDDRHLASDIKPTVTLPLPTAIKEKPILFPNLWTITINPQVTSGSPYAISDINIFVDNVLVHTMTTPGSYSYNYTVAKDEPAKTLSVQVVVNDTGYYSATSTTETVEIPKYTVIPIPPLTP